MVVKMTKMLMVVKKEAKMDSRSEFLQKKSVLRSIFDAYPKAYFRGVVGSEALYNCALF